MNDFVERLPWRIAALAGLLVGAASWWGGTDLWMCLLRVGAAFLVFWLLGWGLRATLQTPPPPSHDGRGKHLDASTPDMTVDDLKPKGPTRPDRDD